MEAHKCKERGINDIGFLDPTSINEATLGFMSTVDVYPGFFCPTTISTCIPTPIYFHLTIIRVIFILDVLNAVATIFSLGST
jgi:hypothetical protein